MEIELLPATHVAQLMRTIEKEYAPYYYNSNGENKTEQLCALTTSFLRVYVLKDASFVSNIPEYVSAEIKQLLKLIQTDVSVYYGLAIDLLQVQIKDLIISPKIVGLIVIMAEEL